MEKQVAPNIKVLFSVRKIKKQSNYKILFSQKNYMGVQETQTLEDKNPNFKKAVVASYSFEKRQECQISLKESKEGGNFWVINTTLGDIVGGRNSTKKFKIQHMLIIAKAETIAIFAAGYGSGSSSEDHVRLGLRGRKLHNTDGIIGLFNKSDPFFRLNRIEVDGSQNKVFESEHFKNTSKPKWKQIEIPLFSLIDPKRGSFMLEVWDDEKNKAPQSIGAVEIKLEDIKAGKDQFMLAHPKHKKPGKVLIYRFELIKKSLKQAPPPPADNYETKFLKYKQGGLELTSIVSIDFTKSNGDPADKTSLHYSGRQKNHYTTALTSIVDIINKFDSENEIPVYGFGAFCEFPKFTKSEPQYLIPLTGNADKPFIPYEGIVDCYRQSLKYLKFNGPTFVKPVLAEANTSCAKHKAFKNFERYLVVLILTDGAVDDIGPAKKELQMAVNLPISLVMVGIGHGDFSGMKELVEHASQLSRPLFQFVEFNKYKNNGEALAESILKELPRQVVLFLEGKKIEPNEVDVDLSDFQDD